MRCPPSNSKRREKEFFFSKRKKGNVTPRSTSQQNSQVSEMSARVAIIALKFVILLATLWFSIMFTKVTCCATFSLTDTDTTADVWTSTQKCIMTH